MLDIKTFSNIIQNTPLISIDLIVTNRANQVLLGKRVNEPAKNFWFDIKMCCSAVVTKDRN